jgi:hypothetical protein
MYKKMFSFGLIYFELLYMWIELVLSCGCFILCNCLTAVLEPEPSEPGPHRITRLGKMFWRLLRSCSFWHGKQLWIISLHVTQRYTQDYLHHLHRTIHNMIVQYSIFCTVTAFLAWPRSPRVRFRPGLLQEHDFPESNLITADHVVKKTRTIIH